MGASTQMHYNEPYFNIVTLLTPPSCWSLKYFRTACLNFTPLINCFGIFAVCEHCLLAEQLETFESNRSYVYKSIAVSADDNPRIFSGNIAHGGIPLLWKHTTDYFATPLENI